MVTILLIIVAVVSTTFSVYQSVKFNNFYNQRITFFVIIMNVAAIYLLIDNSDDTSNFMLFPLSLLGISFFLGIGQKFIN